MFALLFQSLTSLVSACWSESTTTTQVTRKICRGLGFAPSPEGETLCYACDEVDKYKVRVAQMATGLSSASLMQVNACQILVEKSGWPTLRSSRSWSLPRL